MKNGSVFTFGDRMLVAVHISSHLAAEKEHTFVLNDNFFFFIWFPVEQCKVNKIGTLNRIVCLYIVFLPIYPRL